MYYNLCLSSYKAIASIHHYDRSVKLATDDLPFAIKDDFSQMLRFRRTLLWYGGTDPKTDNKKIQLVEMWAYRQILRIRTRITLKERKLQPMCHTLRSEGEYPNTNING